MHRVLIGWIKVRRDDGSSATTRERIHRRAVVAVVEWGGGNTIHTSRVVCGIFWIEVDT